MKFCLIFLVFISLSLVSGKTTAQSQTGCYVSSNNTVYPNAASLGLLDAVLAALFGTTNPYYSTNPKYSECGWSPLSTSSSCKVCSGTYTTFLGIVDGCSGSMLPGMIGTYTPIDCPLDDYTWLIALASGTFGFILVRRNASSRHFKR